MIIRIVILAVIYACVCFIVTSNFIRVTINRTIEDPFIHMWPSIIQMKTLKIICIMIGLKLTFTP